MSAEDTWQRLERWADAREKRNTPGGHGKEGTALLRAAAAELVALAGEAERLRELADDLSAQANVNASVAGRYRDALQRIAAIPLGGPVDVRLEEAVTVARDVLEGAASER